MNRKAQTEAANVAVHAAIAEICAAGHDPQDVGNVLLAYALKMMTDHNGQPAVARHLQGLALQFAHPLAQPFVGSTPKH